MTKRTAWALVGLGVAALAVSGCCATIGGQRVCAIVPTAAPVASATTTASPSPAPVVSATSVPAPTVTPTPGAVMQTTTLDFVNGFGGCNPCHDDTGNVIACNRSACRGDRTAWYVMPGFATVPKGAHCADFTCKDAPPEQFDACMRDCSQDTPGLPCHHAASCDDHVVCWRNWVGCGCPTLGKAACTSWDAASPHPGSQLTATGVACTDVNGFTFDCSGTPGAPYTLCAAPWPGATTADGRPIPGGRTTCVSGLF